MGVLNKKFFKMSDRNSSPEAQNSAPPQNLGEVEIDTLTTPESLQVHFGIGKSAYYDDIRFLRAQGHPIKTHRDEEKRTIVEPETVQLLSALRSHVVATGSREGFKYGELSVVGETSLGDVATSGLGDSPSWEQDTPVSEIPDLERLIRQAQELAAHNMAIGDLVVAQLAQQMTFDDLALDLQGKVTEVREATRPKACPAEIASRVLTQWRSQRGATAA
jgi:hypothetical protein